MSGILGVASGGAESVLWPSTIGITRRGGGDVDSIGKRVVEAIAAMDLSKLADCFTDDAAMSALIP